VAEICEHLRRTVADTNWADIAPGISVSFSAGVAGMSGGFGRGAILNAADRKLYQAKNSGRNLVLS
jgi:PleD family two-component response regulator